VSLPAAVEALHVDVPEGAVEDGQLVHVGGAQRNHLARQIRRIRKYKGMYAIHCAQLLSLFPLKKEVLNYHEFSTQRPKNHKAMEVVTPTKRNVQNVQVSFYNIQALLYSQRCSVVKSSLE
jgi:hypothetical protein